MSWSTGLKNRGQRFRKRHQAAIMTACPSLILKFLKDLTE